MISFTLAILLFGQSTNGNGIDYETARFERKLQTIKISERITIDGRIDEPAWAKAAVAGNFIQNEPDEGAPATEPTSIRVLYDQDSLYLAVEARDSEINRAIVTELRKDFNRDNGDQLVIAIDTFHDERNAYQFAINPAGAKWDAQMVNEGRETNSNWDGVWYVEARILDDGWVAEIAIPFKTLKFPRTPVQTWGINFQRGLRRRNEDSFWSPLPRIYGIQRVSMAGTLEGLEGIEPGANVKLKPYAVSNFLENGRTGKRTYTGDIGFDVKYGVTTGLTWDFTYNTDFAQVEADEQQINLTRFNLFFPEKRDFFLENSGIFQFGSNERGAFGGGGGGGGGGDQAGVGRQVRGNDMVMFFSRRIGLSDPNDATPAAIPILGGTRLTGRIGEGYEIGLLNIQQRGYGDNGATNFTVGRLRKNIFSNSDIGFMITNKEVQDSNNYNRVVGADANFRIGRYTSINSYIAKAAGPDASSRNLAGRAGFSYRDDSWNLSSHYTSIQENFNNEMGFVPRRGIRKLNSGFAYTWRPEKWRKWIRQINPHTELDYTLDRHGRLETRYIQYHFPFGFQNGANIETGVNPSLEYLAAPFVISSLAQPISPGVYRSTEYFINVRSDNSRKLSGNIQSGAGPFYTGYKRTYVAGAVWRQNYKLTTSFNYTRNNIDLPEGNFDTDLFGARVNYGFSTTVFLNALVQYNSTSQQWSSNIRFNIIHRPLSDFFIVYNERRHSLTGDLVDRALIAKVTYMIAR
jgi:hypothetical protein